MYLKGLRALRKSAGLTQSALAEKLGVTQTIVAMWECGQKYPSADKLPTIAKVLGCTIDELFAAAS